MSILKEYYFYKCAKAGVTHEQLKKILKSDGQVKQALLSGEMQKQATVDVSLADVLEGMKLALQLQYQYLPAIYLGVPAIASGTAYMVTHPDQAERDLKEHREKTLNKKLEDIQKV